MPRFDRDKEHRKNCKADVAYPIAAIQRHASDDCDTHGIVAEIRPQTSVLLYSRDAEDQRREVESMIDVA
eukprot:8473689-Pyramimonas_sp.AAC.1